MKAKQKLKSKAGFTLAETLLAVMILLLVSVIVANGIPAAKNAYNKVIVASNAQLMLSTAATALRDELGTAWDVKIDNDVSKTQNGSDGTFVTYYSANTGGISKLYKTDADGIRLQEYMQVNIFDVVDNNFFNSGDKSHISDTNDRRLVSKQTGAGGLSGNLIVTYDKVKYLNDCIVFSNLKAGPASNQNLVSIPTLTIPVISAASST